MKKNIITNNTNMKNYKYLALVLTVLGLSIGTQVFGTNMVLQGTGFQATNTKNGNANTVNSWDPSVSSSFGTCTTTANGVTITSNYMKVKSTEFILEYEKSLTISVSSGGIYRIVFKPKTSGVGGSQTALTKSNGVWSGSDTWECGSPCWGFTKGKSSVTFTSNTTDYEMYSINVYTYREATYAEAHLSTTSFTVTADDPASKSTTLTTTLGSFDGGDSPYYNSIDQEGISTDDLEFDDSMYGTTYSDGSTISFDIYGYTVGNYTPAVLLGRQTNHSTENYTMTALWLPFSVTVEDGCATTPTLAFGTPGTMNKKLGDAVFANAATSTPGTGTTGQTIAYSSSDPQVATVNSSGQVTLGSKCGSTTITASVESNGTYCSASTTYTINLTGYSVAFHYPACAESSPANLTNQYGSVSLETDMAVAGYAFAGWTDHAVTTNPSSVSPLYTSTVSVSSNIDLYAVYTKTSSTFTLVDKGTTAPEAGEYVIVSSYSQGSTKVMTAELDGTKGKLKTNGDDYSITAVKTISCQEEACIWTIASVSGGFTIRNNSTGKYLSATSGATGTSDQKLRLDDETGDYTTWSISRESNKVPFTTVNNKRNTDSETNKNLMCSGNFFAFYSSGTSPFLFKRASSAGTYTSNPDCDAAEYTVTMQSAEGGTAEAAATGGTWSAPVLSGLHGSETVTITATPATGYDFSSWTVVSGGASLASTTTNPTTFTMPTNNVVIRPNFTAQSYSIEYRDKNGASAASFSGTHEVGYPTNHTYGTATTLDEPTKTDYVFMGWFAEADCSGSRVSTIGATDYSSGPIVLYALWMQYSDPLAWCPEPEIHLTGDNVYITSTNGKSIMGVNTLTLNAINLVPGSTVRLSTPASSGIMFSKSGVKYNATTATVDFTANPGGDIIDETVYVHYYPTTAGSGTPADITVKAEYQTNTDYYSTQDVHVRNMPSAFAIAVKQGNSWFALPADMGTTETNPAGVPLNVDESSWTAKGPSTLAYELWPVLSTTGSADRYADYGEKVRFSGNSNAGLWASTSTNTVKNHAAISAIGTGTATTNYEWNITTAVDGSTWKYTLQMQGNSNLLHYYNSSVWGSYASGVSDIYLIPLTTVETAGMAVMEWGESEVAVKCAANTTLSKVTIDGTEVSPKPSLTQICGDIYKITGGGMPNLSTLATYAMKPMVIEVEESSTAKQFVLTIPFILTSSNSPSAEPKTAIDLRNYAGDGSQDAKNKVISVVDVVIRNGARLDVTTAEGNAKACKFNDLYIYPGGKMHINTNDIGLSNVYLRGGFSWLEGASKDYRLPQMLVESGRTISGIGDAGHGVYYDLYLDNAMYYMTAFPKDVLLSAVTNEEGTADWTGWVKGYSGEGRTLNPKESGWKYAWEISPGTTLYRGRGYEIAIKPRYKGAMSGRTIGILRFPLLQATAWTDEATPDITVTAWGIDDANVSANNKGWNYIGNPFFTSFRNTDENGRFGTNMEIRNLKEEIKDGKWTGKYEWVTDASVKYITVPDKMYENYTDVKAKNYEIEAFFPFFIQASATGSLTFTGNKILRAPAFNRATVPAREVEIDFTLSDQNGKTDNAGLVVGNDYSEEFDMDDKEKTIVNENFLKIYTIVGTYRTAFNSLPENAAALPIPVGYIAPAEGTYTFALDDEDYSQVEHVWLTDYEKGMTVDLLDDVYEFQAAKGTNDVRFVINVILKPESNNTATGVDNIDTEGDGPMKFIHEDKMFIRMNGIIYDATGKKVREINK